MVDSIAFRTRARTIDHLGREQIADCPTAISELWKNSYDAYATKAELHIFDGENENLINSSSVCALVDNGHGMSRDEFERKWLTVGTDSKLLDKKVDDLDKCDLSEVRPKQGQKGIGRLSCATLGKLLLIVSKRKNSPFVAALIDWRLFENPFLLLHDIQVPVVEFEKKEDLIDLQSELFNKLIGNLWADSSDELRSLRVEEAWSEFSIQEMSALTKKEKAAISNKKMTTKSRIEDTVLSQSFSSRHFSSWDVWNGKSEHGTAMFIAGIHNDLDSQLIPKQNRDGTQERGSELLRAKLLNFVDPYAEKEASNVRNFKTLVYAWNGKLRRPIIDAKEGLTKAHFDDLEHIVEGHVDEKGVFTGRVKSFGKWNEKVLIEPKVKYKTTKATRFGPFDIRFGAYEGNRSTSTLSDDQHAEYEKKAKEFSGFLIHRDGLRVMPYGVESNDFFEVEKRRSINAGDYVWSNRRIFGRIKISREENPNLKDKAGREGFIDNNASKIFREIVENILIDVAFRFVGKRSSIRKPILDKIKKERAKQKLEKDRQELIKNQLKSLKLEIENNSPKLEELILDLGEMAKSLAKGLFLESKQASLDCKNRVNTLGSRLSALTLRETVPHKLRTVEKLYKAYKENEEIAQGFIKQLDSSVNAALARYSKNEEYDTAIKIYESKLDQLNLKIRALDVQGREVLEAETFGFSKVVKECQSIYINLMADSLKALKTKKVSFDVVLEKLDKNYLQGEYEVIQRLTPYVTGLENIKQQIDLEGLAIHGLNEAEKWKDEVGRLHQLAQLGITVEVIGHEMEGLDSSIMTGLKALEGAKFNKAEQLQYKNILDSQRQLTDKWRFLSPLKLSGEKYEKDISGEEIFVYVNNYFTNSFESDDIDFDATPAFRDSRLYEQPARIFPVFINLVNNSRYWVKYSEQEEKKIVLDIIGNQVVVADNGPGVSKQDYDQLFTIFFSRKQRGGRGIGLYLCRQNLRAGGHSIRYAVDPSEKILSGANFIMDFRGITSGRTTK